MTIILCGYKASGKTTLAKAYSKKYNCNYIDTDQLIIEAFGSNATITSIYNQLGESEFRKLEYEVVQTIPYNSGIIATGGGTIVNKASIERLRALGKIVYLQVDKIVLSKRILQFEPSSNLINKNNLAYYLNSRDNIYQSVADYVINIKHQTICELVSELYYLSV